MSSERQDVAQRHHAGRAARAAGAGRRHDGVAGVEQHGAAVLHVGVDAGQRRGRGLAPRPAPPASRSAGRTTARRARCRGRPGRRLRARCAGRETSVRPCKPGLADVVDLGVAGDHIGEPRLDRGPHARSQVGRRRAADVDAALACGRIWTRPRWSVCCASACVRTSARDPIREHECRGRARGRRRRIWPMPAGEEEHHQRVEREQRQRRHQHRAAQVLRLADLIGLEPRAQRRVSRSRPAGRRARACSRQAILPAGRRSPAGGRRWRARHSRPAPGAWSRSAGRTRRSRRGCGSAAPPRARRLSLSEARWSAVVPASADDAGAACRRTRRTAAGRTSACRR